MYAIFGHIVHTLLLTGFYCKSQYYFKSICRQEKIRVFRYRINFVGELSYSFDDRVSNLTRCICWLHKNKLEKFSVFWLRHNCFANTTRDWQKKNTFQLTLTPFGRDVLFKPNVPRCTSSLISPKFSPLRFPRESLSIQPVSQTIFFSINCTEDHRYDYPCREIIFISIYIFILLYYFSGKSFCDSWISGVDWFQGVNYGAI